MPGYHHSVAVLPLPFRRSVLPFRCAVVTFRCTVAVLPFRRYTVAVARENGIAGNVFPYRDRDEVTRTLIGLAVHLRQNGKVGFHPICYGTAVTVQRQRQVAMATAQRNFST